jgi:hypothetical protein
MAKSMKESLRHLEMLEAKLNPNVEVDDGQALARILERYDAIHQRLRAAGYPEPTPAEIAATTADIIRYRDALRA